MSDCKMIINQFEICGNKLCISAEVNCPYDAAVFSPKVRVFFQMNGRNRRMPLPVGAYLKQEQSETAVILCSYTYLLDHLFFHQEEMNDLTVRFDFVYGDYKASAIPFFISEKIAQKYSGIEIPKERLHSGYGGEFPKTAEAYDPFYKARPYCYRHNISFDWDADSVLITSQREKNGAAASEKSKFVSLKQQLKKGNIAKLLKRPAVALCRFYYKICCTREPCGNRVTFLSGRRDRLDGNLGFVHQILKTDPRIDFRFLLFSDSKGHKKIKYIKRFLELYASSRVVIVDDYFRLLNAVDKRKEVCLIQLWHACGAFKTFGFSRLGKEGGPRQTSPNHRMYDYAVVSSREIIGHYAEGFGLSDEQVIAAGIPRTDIFMDKGYKDRVTQSFYERCPALRGKKIILFAPTFRGRGQMHAFYPVDVFDPCNLCEELGDDYAVIIKLHPFCRERFHILPEYRNRIIDFSDEGELNDLLFVTDLLITDYSSVIFEAALLDIPMLFYAYDLEDYIAGRDFYYEYRTFVPGKIVSSWEELIKAIQQKNFEHQKVQQFKNRFFDDSDGNASKRVADLVFRFIEE